MHTNKLEVSAGAPTAGGSVKTFFVYADSEPWRMLQKNLPCRRAFRLKQRLSPRFGGYEVVPF